MQRGPLELAAAGLFAVAVACGSGNHFGAGEDGGATEAGGDALTPPSQFGDGGNVTPSGASCDDAAKARGYSGCDFSVVEPPLLSEFSRPPCFAAFLANNSTAPAQVKVEYAGQPVANVSKFTRVPNGPDPKQWAPLPSSGIPAGGVAVLFLTDDPTSTEIALNIPLACPVDTAVHEPQGSTVPWPNRGKTFHISTDQPVTAYDMAPFGGAKSFLPSAEILLPTTAWGQNYVVAIPPLAVPSDTSSSPSESSWMQILAKEDNTQVTIAATTDLEADTTADAVAMATPKTITLSAGEYIQFHAWRVAGVAADMSGTILSSNKPVGLIGGDMGAGIVTSDIVKTAPIKGNDTTPRYCCLDSAHQMIPPISGLGSDYVMAPYPTRRADLQEESILYRLVGVVDGTTLVLDPPVAGAPSTIDKGQLVDFEATGPVRIRSQDQNHPFYLAQTMAYSTLSGGTRRDGDPNWPIQPAEIGQRETGDPDFVNVLPPAQFIKQYSFITDPTYAVTSLVLVRTKENGSFQDVTLDCAGTVTGWQPVGTSGDYEIARLDLVRGGLSVGSCQNGAHSAHSSAPFGVTVWAVDWWASYGYPAGGSAISINNVVVQPN